MEPTTARNSPLPPISAWSGGEETPEYPALRALEPADYPRLRQLLAAHPRAICELALANLAIWRDCENPSLTAIHGNLCLQLRPHFEPPYFLEPLGIHRPEETARLCLQAAGRLSRVSAAYVQSLPPGRFHITPLPDQFDYLYETGRLAEMKGKKFDGKRNQIKKFQRQHPDYQFRRLTAADAAAAIDLFQRWFAARERGNGAARFFDPSSFECQQAALRRSFEEFQELQMCGGAVTVGGRIEGFILASPLSKEMINAHFEYANPEMPGIYQLILRQACQQIFTSYPLINLEQDLGIPGLRETKNSYQPLRQEEKFEITLK